MDYDRNDALLHWLFRQTQGDAWFRPNEKDISSGVALRVSDPTAQVPEFRVFPYETAALEPFESAVAALNPLVAVKVRSAAVHAALAEVAPEEKSIYVDANTRIQILDTILMLPQADREQCAAFIRDERVMVIWAESLDRIVPICQEFEDRLIKLLWRTRPSAAGGTGVGTATSTSSVNDHSSDIAGSSAGLGVGAAAVAGQSSIGHSPLIGGGPGGPRGMSDPEKDSGLGKGTDQSLPSPRTPKSKPRRNWFGKKVSKQEYGAAAPDDPSDTTNEKYADDSETTFDVEANILSGKRDAKLYAPVYNGLAAGLALLFVGNGIKTLLIEWLLDGSFVRFALLAVSPLLYCVSLFFALQIIQNITMAFGPIAHFHRNSRYYSAIKPRANKEVDNNLPHITIQMPVYKESLDKVLAPSIMSLKKAMQTYARQGGTSTIFVNDDGLRLLSAPDRDQRLAFYATHNIGWVARPKHDAAEDGFKRAGRFKKASNMNYGLSLSLKAEKHLETLLANSSAENNNSNNGMRSSSSSHGHTSTSTSHGGSHSAHGGKDSTAVGSNHSNARHKPMQYGMQYQNREGDESVVWGTAAAGTSAGVGTSGVGANSGTPNPPNNNTATPVGLADDEDLEEKALALAIEEVWEESGRKWRPWAANGRATRIGEILLLVDSDTVVPEDCLRDAAREMRECPTVAIIQHESDVMQVAHHYFENGISYFTRRINKCISMSCANGEVAPFMGHNAFMRWKAVQDAAFIDPVDKKEKIWSESNVSEDFDMALRLMLKGYIIRWATYSNGAFKEGVSLSVDDELNRWQKYAYGCNELLFNPFIEWFRKGPIAHQIHRFLWSKAPMHYKISMLAYMFSYYGIAASITISLINYVLLGFQFPVDGYFMHSFEIWLATTVVFWGTGIIGYTLLEYRLGNKSLIGGFFENLMWIPFFFFFFGGLSIPLTQALLAHLFSYNIQWSATIKEVQRSNFFKEIPKIAKRFWFPLLLSTIIIAIMAILSTPLVPIQWRVGGSAWAVIFPLSVTVGCHILFPIVLNPWLMVFSY